MPFLDANELGRLGTITPDGVPHVVPVCYVYDSTDSVLHSIIELESCVTCMHTMWRH